MNDQTTPRLCLFGFPRIEVGKVRLDRFPTKRCFQILACLALAHQKRMSRSQLANVLWPDDIYEATRHRLRQELTRLRKALGSFESVIETSAESIRLDEGLLVTDIDEFETLIRTAAQSIDSKLKQTILWQALGVASFPFMFGATEDWIEVERIRLDAARYGAMVDLGNLLLEDGKQNDALALARDAIQVLPEGEGAHLLATRAHFELGHQDNAVAQFQALRRIASKERGRQLSAKAERVWSDIIQPRIGSDANLGLCFHIPAPSEPIFGRDEEIAAIVDLLDPGQTNARLVTVLGMGGIGKTHLIQYACRDLATVFQGRVAFIDLSNIAGADVVPTAIMHALGLGAVPSIEPVGHMRRVLAAEPHVLALDNLEQFGDAIAPLIRKLLDEIPAMRILAGSRIPLNLAGENRLNLAPLELPAESAKRTEARSSPALRLFMSVIQSDQSSAILREADWPVISNIVRRVEGIPLGLQLAASRMRALGPAALLHDLDQGFDHLVNRRADAPQRHLTMRQAVEGSFDRLEPELRQTICSLSIFRGNWSLAAAKSVCQIEDPLAAMQQLADDSLILIVNDGCEVRFSMLETIREYAKSLLTEDRSRDLRKQFVNWMVERSREIAYEIVDDAVREKIDRLERDLDNLREALRYSLDEFPEAAFELGANLTSFWIFRTSRLEAWQFYKELFRRYGSHSESSIVLRASYAYSMIGYLVSSLDNAVIFEQTIRIGQAIGDRSLETRTYVLQAYEAQNTMRYSDCLALFDKIDRFDAEFGSSDCEGFVSRIKGAFALYQGDPEAAIGHFRSAANWFSEKGELFYQARVRLELALAAIDLGDADLAAANLVGLMERANGIRYIIIIPTIRSCMGHVELLRGNYEAAISAFHQSLEAFKELSGLFFEGEQWNAVGRTYLAMGRKSDARTSFGKAAELWLLDGLPVAASVAVFGLAAVCIQEEDFGRAGRLYSVADREIRSAGASLNRFHENFRELVRKEILSRHGDKELALETLTLAEAVSLGSMPSSVRL